MALKLALRNGLRRYGLDVIPYVPERSWAAHVKTLFDKHGFDLVLDVGANTGQYARWLRSLGYNGGIVSFEPLSQAHAELERAAARDPSWSVAPRAALGASNSTVQINVSANSQSSSIRPMLDAHLRAAPDSRYTAVEEVTLARLDTLAADVVRAAKSPFLKIDTQGYESEVLEGASGLLPLIRGLQLELSLIPLYERQSTLAQVIEDMRAQGFGCFALWPGFVDPASGRLLQADGIFIRESSD